jgi:hypothetical protein
VKIGEDSVNFGPAGKVRRNKYRKKLKKRKYDIRIRWSKILKKKDKGHLQNTTQKTKDRATRTPAANNEATDSRFLSG